MFFYLGFFFLFILISILFFKKNSNFKQDFGCKKNRRVKQLQPKVQPLGILSEYEKKMYRLLVQAIPNDRFSILAQVSFNAFIGCKEPAIRNKFNRMFCDFLIIDEQFNPVVCIELDDKSHLATKERDAFRDDLLSAAFIPTERFVGLPKDIGFVEKRLKPYFSNRKKTMLYQTLHSKKRS